MSSKRCVGSKCLLNPQKAKNLGKSNFEKLELFATVLSPNDFHCPFCDIGMQILKENGFHVIQKKLTSEELQDMFGEECTVPQIFIGSFHLGGVTELKEMLQKKFHSR